jgi:hypothetical protein
MGVLRRLFGPSREEVWRRLSEEIGGRYVDGSWSKSGRVDVTHGEWTVTLDTYAVSNGKTVVVFTRMRAPYVNPEGFRFTVYRRSVFSGVGKWFGMQDVEIGDAEFDDDFIVKATDESRVRQLLSSTRLRELLGAQPSIHFSVKDDEGWFGAKYPEGVDVLSFVVGGVIKDVERLKTLFELFSVTLDELCRMGSAYESDPGVKV